ncbi:hypothetical protein [Ktedonobacter racemifer]|nr:hypothetical protein [Ktedonobacter racemifer]
MTSCVDMVSTVAGEERLIGYYRCEKRSQGPSGVPDQLLCQQPAP